MRWCFGDAGPYADNVLDRLLTGDRALVPSLWCYEVVSVVAKSNWKGILSTEQARSFLDRLESLPIEIDENSPQIIFNRVYLMAKRYRLTGYDATYLELAQRKQLPIATLDEELRQAAMAAGVGLI